MLQTPKLRAVLAIPLIGLLLLTGCSSDLKGVNVKGTVVLPPNVKMDNTDVGSISFSPETPDPKVKSAPTGQISASDQTFVLKGPQGKGVPPGKYKVTVNFTPYMGMPGTEQRQAAYNRLNDTFGAKQSKLTYDVTNDGEQTITVDLDKGTITKN